MRIGFVAVGDELLAGAVTDVNTGWLARRLAQVGGQLVRAATVGDQQEAITAAVRAMLGHCEAVVVSGGLGPTSDDRTRPALAELAGGGLHRDPALARAVRERAALTGLGPAATELAVSQADLPVAARSLPNPVGTAPGLRLEVDGRPVYALPGVVAEFRALVETYLVAELADPAAPSTRLLRTASLPEPLVAQLLEPLAGPGLSVAYLPDAGLVDVRLTGVDQRALAVAEARARQLLGPAVYATESGSLAAAVQRALVAAGATVAAAESLTGGLLAADLTDTPGASAVFLGSVTAYATELKAGLLGVDRELLAREGAVHPRVAGAMAEGVRGLLGSDHGVATTGVAGPDPQDGRPVGTVYVAVAGPGGTRVGEVRARGDRFTIRRRAVHAALDLLRRQLTVAGEHQADPPR